MAEDNDYSPGEWEGYDYTSAKSAYVDTSAGRGYGSSSSASSSSTSSASTSSFSRGAVVPDFVMATCKRPLVLVVDMTGSMDAWRDIIGKKLAYMDKEVPSYLGEDTEICMAAIGDAPQGDDEPLQVRPFCRGTGLVEHVSVLNKTGGGGDHAESYELAGLYFVRNARYAADARPVMIFIGDEGLHEYVEARHAKWAHIETQGAKVSTDDIMKELTAMYSVYIVRKPYPSAEARVNRQWSQYLGAERVFLLEAPERILDMIFGILAIETGKMAYFEDEITNRQTPEQCATVFTSLRTQHVGATGGKSVMLASGAKATKHLLGKK